MYFKDCIYLKKGRLFHSEWNGKLQAYDQHDITNSYKSYLMRSCELAPGTTLNDIIAFVEKDLPFWSEIVTPDLPLFIKESKLPIKKDDLNFKFLELYYYPESSVREKNKKDFSGMLMPSFHAKGIPGKEDIPFNLKKDELINYSISFLELNSYSHYPVKLNKELKIGLSDDLKLSWESTPNLGVPEYNLIGIIYGIFWEVSFYGGPARRNAQGKSILNSTKKFKKKTTKGKKSP